MAAPKVQCVPLLRVLRHCLARTFLSSSSKMANESGQKTLDPFPHFGTLAIHAGQEPEQWNSRAVVPPISMATTFKQDAPAVHRVSLIPFATYSHRNRSARNTIVNRCVISLSCMHLLGIRVLAIRKPNQKLL